MSKHIVVVNDYGFINGGAGKIAIYTAVGLSKQGEDVTFFCSVGPVCDELKRSKVKVVCLNQTDINNKKNKFEVLFDGVDNKVAKKSFKRLIDSFGEDEVIIHIHSWTKAISSSPFRYLKKKKNVKSIVTLHDYFTICPNGGLYDYKHKCICHVKNDFKCFFCNCDKRNYFQKLFRFYRYKRQQSDMKSICNFIYISQLNKRVFLEKYKQKANMFFIRNFVDLAPCKIENIEKNDIFLYIGRISEEKGIDELCGVLTKKKKKGVIIGDGPMYEELKVKYPNLIFTGWLNKEQMIPYILKSKAFVFPSKWYEGAPLVIEEMLSYGLPCIVRDCSSAVEYIDNYKNGIIYDNHNLLLEDALEVPFSAMNNIKLMSFNNFSDYIKSLEQCFDIL